MEKLVVKKIWWSIGHTQPLLLDLGMDFFCCENDLELVEHPIWNFRAHLEKEAIAERSLFRTILMIGFHMVVYIFAVRSIRDTQCGFKMLSRAAAAKVV